MESRAFTKKPMRLSSVRISEGDSQLWRAAAAREEISRSDFLRRAIRDRARKVLLSAMADSG